MIQISNSLLLFNNAGKFFDFTAPYCQDLISFIDSEGVFSHYGESWWRGLKGFRTLLRRKEVGTLYCAWWRSWTQCRAGQRILYETVVQRGNDLRAQTAWLHAVQIRESMCTLFPLSFLHAGHVCFTFLEGMITHVALHVCSWFELEIAASRKPNNRKGFISS